MSTGTVRYAIARLYCDTDDCLQFFEAEVIDTEGRYIRGIADAFGWQTRPSGGKGSRSAPDLCPDHRSPDSHRRCTKCGNERSVSTLVEREGGTFTCRYSWDCRTPERWLQGRGF